MSMKKIIAKTAINAVITNCEQNGIPVPAGIERSEQWQAYFEKWKKVGLSDESARMFADEDERDLLIMRNELESI